MPNPLLPLIERIADLEAKVKRALSGPPVRLREGVVTGSGAIHLAGDADPLPAGIPHDRSPGDDLAVLQVNNRAYPLARVDDTGWLTYSPVFFSATGTDPTMGNSSVSGRYRVDGKTVHVSIYIVFGSTFSVGSGLYGATLPVAPHPTHWQQLLVTAVMGGERTGSAKIEGSAGILRIIVLNAGAMTALGAAAPAVIPASGNRLLLSGTYEAADSIPPTPGTLAVSAITSGSFTLTVTGASDETALHATPYAFSDNNGATWTAWRATPSINMTGLTAETAYQARHRVRDAALNVALGSAIPVETAPA